MYHRIGPLAAGACARALNGGTARSRRESVFHSARIGFPRLVFCACGAGIGANDPSANPFSKQLDKETLAAQKVNECNRLVTSTINPTVATSMNVLFSVLVPIS